MSSVPWRIITHFIKRFNTLRLPLVAAGLTYYAIFSLGPILLLLAGTIAFTVERNSQAAQNVEQSLVAIMTEIFPSEARVAEYTHQAFDTTFSLLQEGAILRSLISLVLLLWSASGFFTSLQIVLEGIFEDATAKKYWQKRLIGVLLIFLTGVVISVELIGTTALNSIAEFIMVIEQHLNTLWQLELAWQPFIGINFLNAILRFALATLVFILCYRFLTGKASSWLAASVGGLFSSLAIVITKMLLPLFFNLERFNLIYGIITSALVILFWLYISLLLFLLGALLAAEISDVQERQAPEQNVTKLP